MALSPDLAAEPAALPSSATDADRHPFRLHLAGFEGPLDLLLSLIGKHELDITELSLSQVTDEFLAHLNTLDDGDLDAASDFLLVGATLLDLKIAGLLPQGELVDAESVALLEARDLLFARLLQYRAFKDASSWFATTFAVEAARHPRQVPLDEQYRRETPVLDWRLSPAEFGELARIALTPRDEPQVRIDHLHAAPVSLREQAAHVAATLRQRGTVSFRELVDGASSPAVVVARFLAVLELYRHDAVTFQQIEPLGELTVQWSGGEWDAHRIDALGGDWDD